MMITLWSQRLEQALRFAAIRHHGQTRRSSEIPYVEHVFAVAMILQKLGLGEDVVIAGLLHDVVEDTETTPDEVRQHFGTKVAELVSYCTEIKLDALGQKRPWIDRKRDYLDALAKAPVEAQCLALADKLHNLVTIQLDLHEGRDIWSSFHADRASVLENHHAVIDMCRVRDEPSLSELVNQCSQVLAEIELR